MKKSEKGSVIQILSFDTVHHYDIRRYEVLQIEEINVDYYLVEFKVLND